MSLISLQSVTTNGTIIDNARWLVNLSNFQVGNQLEIMIQATIDNVKDKVVINFLKKYNKLGYSIDQIDRNKFSIALSFSIKQIRHLVDVKMNQTETLCTITPINKFIEDVVLFIYDEQNCDPKFIKYINEL